MKTKGKSIFFICLAMIVSGVILFSVIYSGQMVSAAQRVETYKDNGEDKSEMTQESIQSQEKTVREQAEYMEELEEEQNIAHSEILEVMGVRNALAVKMNTIERALQTMTLTKSPQKMFAAYYADGTFNGQESVLYLNQEVVWCLEPSELVGNVGKGMRRSGCRIDTGGVGTKLIIWQKLCVLQSSILEIMVCVDMHWYKI